MPEGDTVFLTAHNLNRALADHELTRTDFRVPDLATVDLSGRVLQEVATRGKHLLLRIGDDFTVHAHFMMDGTFHLYRPGERWREPAHEARLILETDEWQAVGFRLRVIELLARDREVDAVGHLGPDILGADWNADEALRLMEKDPDRPIGTALLDQTVIAGLGNVYKSEICFLRGVDPWTPVGDVPDLPKLIATSKRAIEANRFRPGHVTTGDTRPGRTHWVYGRRGQPCRRCGTRIKRAMMPGHNDVERVTYWCPSCQPRPDP